MDLLPLASSLNTLTTTASNGGENVLLAEGADLQLDFAALLAAGLTAQLAAADPAADPGAIPQAPLRESPLGSDAGLQSASPAAETGTSMTAQLPLPAALPPSESLPRPITADASRAVAADGSASRAVTSKPADAPTALAADAADIAAPAPPIAAAAATAPPITPAAATEQPITLAAATAQPIASGSLHPDQSAAAEVLPAEPALRTSHATETTHMIDTPPPASAAAVSHPLHTAGSEQRLAVHPVAVREIGAPVSDSDFADAFSRQVVWIADKDAQIAELRLNPPELGPIEVRLKLTGGEASAQFVSPHAEVRSAIESSLVRLREALAEAGIALGDASVSAESFRDDGDASQADARRNNAGYREPERSPEQSPHAPRLTPARVGMIDVFA